MMNESTDPPTPEGQEQPGKRQQTERDKAWKITPREAYRVLELMLESVRRREAREANEKPKK